MNSCPISFEVRDQITPSGFRCHLLAQLLLIAGITDAADLGAAERHPAKKNEDTIAVQAWSSKRDQGRRE
jgi:hypothetical protein